MRKNTFLCDRNSIRWKETPVRQGCPMRDKIISSVLEREGQGVTRPERVRRVIYTHATCKAGKHGSQPAGEKVGLPDEIPDLAGKH